MSSTNVDILVFINIYLQATYLFVSFGNLGTLPVFIITFLMTFNIKINNTEMNMEIRFLNMPLAVQILCNLNV